MKVLKPHSQPYYIEIDSDPIEFNSPSETLNKHNNSLKSKSAFKNKLGEMLGFLEDEI